MDLPLNGLPGTAMEYTADFHMANTRLNEALFRMAGSLQQDGYRAFPVPYKEMPGWNLENRPPALMNLLKVALSSSRIHPLVEGRLRDNLSYRHVAAAAGLGEIGINNLLLHPEHGPRVRLVALVTDAEMEPSPPLAQKVCKPEECGYACVRACPARALANDGSPTRKASCLQHYLRLGLPGMSGVRCGLCVKACPAFHTPERKKHDRLSPVYIPDQP
ncbi:MAG: hypothetical protein ACYC55_08125 [Candidatus Geothermincolia bacterium]